MQRQPPARRPRHRPVRRPSPPSGTRSRRTCAAPPRPPSGRRWNSSPGQRPTKSGSPCAGSSGSRPWR
nr:MAG: hypothetical protein DIU70_10825 [Bacillota bacterium]